MTDSSRAKVESTEPREPPANPYVGPRPFRKGELFFGRERETKGLLNMLLAGRIVMLHSPSGAGKTSLVRQDSFRPWSIEASRFARAWYHTSRQFASAIATARSPG